MRADRNVLLPLAATVLLIPWTLVTAPAPGLLVLALAAFTGSSGILTVHLIRSMRRPQRPVPPRFLVSVHTSQRALETLIIAFIASSVQSASGEFAIALPAVYLAIRSSRGVHAPLQDLTGVLAASLALPLFIAALSPYPVFSAILLLSGLTGFLVKYYRTLAVHLHLRKEPEETLSREAYDKMLATLAHEIRTPLTIMQTTENVLMEQIPGPLNPRQKKFMESIYINTQRLITFSENMLTLLKIGQEWKPDLSKTIDLRILTKQVIDMVQPLIQLRSQKIRYSFPSRVARPYADEAWIRQVLVNLIHNASKHTEEGGTIVVSLTQDDEQVVLTVSDNGQGLLGEGRETLFKEFYQEDHDLKTYQDGFGLGLAIVRTVIGRHRGNVYITSSRNLGTMVSFNLPVEAEQ